MGSGEDHAAYIARTLDAFHLCGAPGCETHIEWGKTRCYRHGGERGTEWESSADGKRFSFMSGDAEDDPPRTAA